MGHCYPSWERKDQIQIIIARQHKKTKKLELMIGSADLRIGRTTIIVPKFRKGKNVYELFEFDGRYKVDIKGHHGSDDNNLLKDYVVFMN